MNKKLNNWSKEDILFIENNFYNMTVKEIAKKLSKSENSLFYQIRKMGLKKQNHKPWTEDENKYLIDNYMETSDFLSKKLGRTVAAINTQKDRLGLVKDKPWTQTDINYLKDHYICDLYCDIAKHLKRTEGAIRAKCHDLGLVQKDAWTDEDIEFLSQNYKELTNNELAKILDRTQDSIHIKASKLGLKKYPYTANYHYFDVIDTEEKAYWLGFITADGWVNKNEKTNSGCVGIELQYGDIEHLKKFNKSISGNYQITDRWKKCELSTRDKNKKNHMCCIRIFSIKMYESLFQHGITPNKTFNVDVPRDVPEKLIKHFLRGFFDGDGCFSFTKKSFGVSFLTASEKLIISIEEILDLININYNRKTYINEFGTKMYRTYIYRKEDKIKLLDYMYSNSNIYLNRKYEKYLKVKSAYTTKNFDKCLAC